MSNPKPKNALAETAKAFFSKFVKTQAIKYLISLGLKVSGPMGIVYNYLITKGLKLFYAVCRKLKINLKENIETKKELKEYKGDINAPGASEEDIAKAGENFLGN